MSSTPTLTAPTLTRAAQAPAALSAIAGAGAWLLWWPLVPYLAVAGVSWLWLAVLNPSRATGEATWTALPAATILLASIAAVGLLWALGARHALALGHDRGLVFALTLGLSVAVPALHHAVSLLANQAELAVLGEGGYHVFTLSGPVGMDKFATNAGLLSPSWILFVLYLVPLLMAVVVASAAGLRWGAPGAVAGLVASVAAILGVLSAQVLLHQAFYALFNVEAHARAGDEGPAGVVNSIADVLGLGAWAVIVVGLAWAAARLFRRVRA